jgi:hypothetical protein
MLLDLRTAPAIRDSIGRDKLTVRICRNVFERIAGEHSLAIC